MTRWLALLTLAAPLAAPTSAWAQDDDEIEIDLLEDEEDDGSDDEDRLDAGDDLESGDDSQLDDLILEGDEGGEDLLGGEPAAPTASDSAQTYRATQERVEDLGPDEEVMVWEAYLEKYPDTTYRERIQRRIDELLDVVYGENIERRVEAGTGGGEQFRMSQPLLLDNIAPAHRLQFGFEWGLPNYINLLVDYERPLRDNLSVHGGLRHRYTGWSLEGGVRWAAVRSLRTKTLVTVLGDVRVNANPAYPALRPQIAFGKKFGELVDLQVQAGTELDSRDFASPRLIGGAHSKFTISENVGVFLETSFDTKPFTSPDIGPFVYHVVSFGLKFYPSGGQIRTGDMEANLGASAPAASRYWMYHFGSIMGQGNYYFPDN